MHWRPAQPARPLGQSEALRLIVVHMRGGLTRSERVFRLPPAALQRSGHDEMVYGEQTVLLGNSLPLN